MLSQTEKDAQTLERIARGLRVTGLAGGREALAPLANVLREIANRIGT